MEECHVSCPLQCPIKEQDHKLERLPCQLSSTVSHKATRSQAVSHLRGKGWLEISFPPKPINVTIKRPQDKLLK